MPNGSISTTASAKGNQVDYTNPRLEAHMTFVCPECGEEYESQQDWRKHLNEEHDYLHKTAADFDFREINEGYHECQVCHKWVANANQAIALLQYHRFLHLPFNRTYRCRHCKGGFSRKRALCEHLYRFHSRQIIKVEKLKRAKSGNITELRTLRDPQQNTEFYMRFLCPQCGMSIDRYEQWLEHLNTHPSTSTELNMHRISGSKNHYCLQCKKLLYTCEHAKLQRHRFTHMPYKMYFKCAYCLVKKSFKSEVFRHFIYAHPGTFNDARPYVQKPQEWGAKITFKLNAELDAILKRNKSNVLVGKSVPSGLRKGVQNVSTESKQTDLIQKALLNSLIDLETEHKVTENSQQKSANEYALDQSLQDLEAILQLDNDFIDSHQHSLLGRRDSNEENEGLEELCQELFEEISEEVIPAPEQPQIGQTKVLQVKQELPKKEQLKDDSDSEADEKIISIEINALDECDQIAQTRNFLSSPPRKRLKLNDETAANLDDDKYKTLLKNSIHYLCPECGSEFKEQTSWREHVFNEHNLDKAMQTSFQLLENQKSYLCLDCMTVQHTTKFSELQRHRFMHMPFQAYLKCTLCNKNKSSKPKMLQHLEQYHQNSLLAMQSELSQPEFRCSSCNKVFKAKWRWRNHSANCLRKGAGIQGTNNNNTIANNMRLLAHLKKARAHMQKIRLACQ